jgi:hypothetical protein
MQMVMVVLSTAGGSNPKLQSVVMAVCSGYITYQMIMAVGWGRGCGSREEKREGLQSGTEERGLTCGLSQRGCR